MKRTVQLILSISILFVLQTRTMSAQYCVPTTLVPYDNNMPGITNFTLGTINRTSAGCEGCPSSNNYVNTAMQTNLMRGHTYTVSITHTVDASICPDMNLRLWIDYNQDHSFDTTTETAINVNHHAPGTYTGTFTVPNTAVLGVTRMRATAKMSDLGGHTIPTPCDNPADPIGYHGEMEDYNANILAASGIDELNGETASFNVYPSMITDNAKISFSLNTNATVTFKLYDAIGKSIIWTMSEKMNEGSQEVIMGQEALAAAKSGIYFLEMMINDQRIVQKVVILK